MQEVDILPDRYTAATFPPADANMAECIDDDSDGENKHGGADTVELSQIDNTEFWEGARNVSMRKD